MGATCGHCALPVSREAQCSRPDCPLRKPPEARVPRFEGAGPAATSLPELVLCAEPKAPARGPWHKPAVVAGVDIQRDGIEIQMVSHAEPKAPAPTGGGTIKTEFRSLPGSACWGTISTIRKTVVAGGRRIGRRAFRSIVGR